MNAISPKQSAFPDLTRDEVETLLLKQNESVRDLLEFARIAEFGLSHPENRCWPTVKPWTKKERDSTLLAWAKKVIAKAEGR